MINLVNDTINKEDINSLINWLSQDPTPKLTKGELTVSLEKKWAEKIGSKFSVFVNSGSSSILLTLSALQQSARLKNNKVVVSSLSWATDISTPIILGMEPILCDCNLEDLSCDLKHLEELFIKHNPSIFILVSPLGLVPNMDYILQLCEKHNVILLEDVCESMGSKYKNQYLGTFGFASFFSMYFGHHLSTIEGGFINTDDEDFYNTLLMMRSHGWDRDLSKHKQQQLREKYQVSNFDALYNFYMPGLNLRSTDLQAFIGLRVIDKLDDYCLKRNKNYELYKQKLTNTEYTPPEFKDCFISNFAYPVLNKNRSNIVENLINNKIEVRPLIAGDMSKKPMWFERYEPVNLQNSTFIHFNGFYVPNHQNLSENDISTICDIINNTL